MADQFDVVGARGAVGPDPYQDTWFEITDKVTLHRFVAENGKTGTEDELYDWDRSHLIALIFKLGDIDPVD